MVRRKRHRRAAAEQVEGTVEPVVKLGEPSDDSRPAASSMASGTPSRRRTMSATRRRSSGPGEKSGSDATGAVDEQGDRWRPDDVGESREPVTGSGASRNRCSAARPSGSRLVASTVSCRAAVEERGDDVADAGQQVLAVVDQQQTAARRRAARRRPRGHRRGRPAGRAQRRAPGGCGRGAGDRREQQRGGRLGAGRDLGGQRGSCRHRPGRARSPGARGRATARKAASSESRPRKPAGRAGRGGRDRVVVLPAIVPLELAGQGR